MKSIVATPGESPILEKSGLMSDLAELIKARLTMLVLLTTAVGYYLGAERGVDWLGLFHAVFGTAMAAAGAAALNQWWERPHDALMHRTRERPIPAGRMRPRNAFLVGAALAVAGVVYLAASCNWLSALLAAATIGIYILAYTPLKRISTVNTLVGAVPGALPPMIGWAAATGGISLEPWLLFLIIFFWTPPHFWALSLTRTEDYARARIPMLPVVAGGTETRRQILLYSITLVPVGVAPWLFGYADAVYGITALVAGLFMVAFAWRVRNEREGARADRAAHHLFAFSILYLFVLFAVLLVEGGLGGFGG